MSLSRKGRCTSPVRVRRLPHRVPPAAQHPQVSARHADRREQRRTFVVRRNLVRQARMAGAVNAPTHSALSC